MYEDKLVQTEVVVPQEAAPPPEVPQNKHHKGLMTGIVFLAIVFLGIAGFFVYKTFLLMQKPTETPTATPTATPTQIPDQTLDWKTYSTSTYLLKYPADMEIREEEGSVLALSKWGPTQKEATEFYDGISVRFQPFELPDINLTTYVDNKILEIKSGGMAEIISGSAPVSVGNYSGLTFTSRGIGTFKYIYIQSSDKQILMEIIDGTVDPSGQGFEETINKIFSTFEFVE